MKTGKMMKLRITEGEDDEPDDAADELKSSLVSRYRKMFVDKLTPEDLEELKLLLRNKFDADRAINQDYLLKFEVRLRDFFHEEFLAREMASIETLIEKLKS